MKTATLDELLVDSELLKENGPILVTKEGHPIGFFTPLPMPDESNPIEVRRALFKKASEKIRRQLDAQGITEEQVDTDIAALFGAERGNVPAPMSKTRATAGRVEEILAAALALGPRCRAELAEKLLQSLDSEAARLSETEWDQAWGAEAERRLAELRDRKVKGIPGDQVFARVRAIVSS